MSDITTDPKGASAEDSMYFHLSIEKNQCCPKCGGKTVLILPRLWTVDSEEPNFPELASEAVEPEEEITAHWCPECTALCSITVRPWG